jgi:hypothetical protein
MHCSLASESLFIEHLGYKYLKIQIYKEKLNFFRLWFMLTVIIYTVIIIIINYHFIEGDLWCKIGQCALKRNIIILRSWLIK